MHGMIERSLCPPQTYAANLTAAGTQLEDCCEAAPAVAHHLGCAPSCAAITVIDDKPALLVHRVNVRKAIIAEITGSTVGLEKIPPNAHQPRPRPATGPIAAIEIQVAAAVPCQTGP